MDNSYLASRYFEQKIRAIRDSQPTGTPMQFEMPVDLEPNPLYDQLISSFEKAYTVYIKRCDDIIFAYFGCFCKGAEAIQTGRVQQAKFVEGHPFYEQGIREQLLIDGDPVAQFKVIIGLAERNKSN